MKYTIIDHFIKTKILGCKGFIHPFQDLEKESIDEIEIEILRLKIMLDLFGEIYENKKNFKGIKGWIERKKGKINLKIDEKIKNYLCEVRKKKIRAEKTAL